MAKTGSAPKRKEVLWSSEIAYGVGLMASDGCLSSNGRHMAFVSKDLEQMENIRHCFGITAKMFLKRGYGNKEGPLYYHLQWGDRTLYNFFLEIGLTPRKSLTICALKIPDIYFFDFLRGSFDGDGCFYSYFDTRWKNSFMFYVTFSSASLEHIVWMREIIERLCLVKGHITRTGKGGKTLMTNLKYAKKESMVLLKHMYPPSTVLCLNRKRLKIVDALSIVNESLPEVQAKI
jgi:hypothetical protein